MDKETEEAIGLMSDKIANALKPKSEQKSASEPFKSKTEKEQERYEKFITKPNEAKDITKKLEAFETGTFLDQLFLDSNGKPIDGIPISGQFIVVGMPDAGKSILMEEIAIKTIRKGHKVLFVTSEDLWNIATPRLDLESRMKQKADILKESWDAIKDNLFVMDVVTNGELTDWETFANAYRYACEKYKIELVIVDSITVLQTHRGALKFRLMELIKYNQLHGITGLFVNQRSKEAWDSYDIAGGIGLAHNADGTILVDFGGYWDNIMIKNEYIDYFGEAPKRKQLLRIVRVLGCRMCNFVRKYQFVDITKDGFLTLQETNKGEDHS